MCGLESIYLQEQIERMMLMLAYTMDHTLTLEQIGQIAEIVQGEATRRMALDLGKNGKPVIWDELAK